MGYRSSAPRVAVLIDGELTIHADRASGDYDTLCGIDANDPDVGHRGAKLPPHRRINCPDCWAIWRKVIQYDRRDFLAALQAAHPEREE